jgi:hypothetical protein
VFNLVPDLMLYFGALFGTGFDAEFAAGFAAGLAAAAEPTVQFVD